MAWRIKIHKGKSHKEVSTPEKLRKPSTQQSLLVSPSPTRNEKRIESCHNCDMDMSPTHLCKDDEDSEADEVPKAPIICCCGCCFVWQFKCLWQSQGSWHYQGGEEWEGRQLGGVEDLWCHQPPLSPTFDCPCFPQCRRSSIHKTLRLSRCSALVESIKKLISTIITTAYHILVGKNSNWSDTS